MGHITNQRLLCSLGGLVSALIGIILIVALPQSNNVGRLIGYYMTQASPTAFVALLSMISSNVAGYTKKTTVAALYLIGYCVGNIIGEQPCPILNPTCDGGLEKRRCAERNYSTISIKPRLSLLGQSWQPSSTEGISKRPTNSHLPSTGPQTFRPKDAPRYVPAEITIIVCLGICLCIMTFIWWWYRKENARKLEIQARPDYVRLENQE